MRHPRKLHASAARMRELMPPDAAELEAEAAYHAARRQREADEAESKLIARFGQITSAQYHGRSVLSDHWQINGDQHIYADHITSAVLRRMAEREGVMS